MARHRHKQVPAKGRDRTQALSGALPICERERIILTVMSVDLSTIHRPITALFPRLEGTRNWRHFSLNATQLEHYHEHGFVAGVQILDKNQIEVLCAALEEFLDPAHDGREHWYLYLTNASHEPGKSLFHALGAWRLRAVFHDLIWHPRIVVPCAQILGRGVRLLHDQLFYKQAREGGSVTWHQDYSYWTYSQPMAHVSCFVALDEATIENGCLQYVPGSHRWDLLPITGAFSEGQGIEGVLNEGQKRAFEPVPIELEAGAAVFHHPLTVHGSGPNLSGRPRRATVVNVMADGTRGAVDLPDIDGIPGWLASQTPEGQSYPVSDAPRGPLLAGRFWPLLHAESPADAESARIPSGAG